MSIVQTLSGCHSPHHSLSPCPRHPFAWSQRPLGLSPGSLTGCPVCSAAALTLPSARGASDPEYTPLLPPAVMVPGTPHPIVPGPSRQGWPPSSAVLRATFLYPSALLILLVLCSDFLSTPHPPPHSQRAGPSRLAASRLPTFVLQVSPIWGRKLSVLLLVLLLDWGLRLLQ